MIIKLYLKLVLVGMAIACKRIEQGVICVPRFRHYTCTNASGYHIATIYAK